MLKSLLPTLLPLLIALSIYAFVSLFLLPLYRRHRARYAQYLPMSSSFNPAYYTSSNDTHNIHDRGTSGESDRAPGIFRRGLSRLRATVPAYFFLPSLGEWHRRYGRYRQHTTEPSSHAAHGSPPEYPDSPSTPHNHDPNSLDRSDTNSPSLFTPEQGSQLVGFDLPASRREDQGRMSSRQINDVMAASSDRRLSRELEEVFRDDSDDEERDGYIAQRQRQR